MAEEQHPERNETLYERADRRWGELLQEVRVAQTGAQILFGFLLSVVFMPRFATLGGFDRGLYVVTVVLGALATGALIAPVSYHRLLSGHRLKPQLVDATRRLVAVGVVLLALTVGSALLLLLHLATGSGLAGVIVAAVMLWFAAWWLVLPWLLIRRNGHHHRRCGRVRRAAAVDASKAGVSGPRAAEGAAPRSADGAGPRTGTG